MSNSVALVLGMCILTAVLANYLLGWGLDVFLGRKLTALIEWLAFWR